MARKRLTKGANAARVEERISRVPADLGSGGGDGTSIFDALRAMDGDAVPQSVQRAPTAAAQPVAKPAAKSAAKAAPKGPTATDAKGRTVPAAPKSPSPKGPSPMRPSPVAKAAPRPRREGHRPIDFSAAERGAIVRCCLEYRNRLPTYLLSVQKEVKVLDSIIEKCGPASSD